MALILVIDDEESILKYFRRALKTLGHEVRTAGDGQTGLERAADTAVDLVITDLNMQGELSELDLVGRLRQQRPECPVVVISGYPTADRLAQCESLGVSEFLTKPFELSFIASVLKRLLPEEPAAAQEAE